MHEGHKVTQFTPWHAGMIEHFWLVDHMSCSPHTQVQARVKSVQPTAISAHY